MQTPVEACWLGEPVEDIAERMRMRDVGFMPVCNGAGEVVGTIGRRDLARCMHEEQLPHGTLVFRVMSIGPITCSASDDVGSLEPYVRRGEPRVICVDGRRRPIGVVDASLLVSSRNRHQEAAREHA